MMEAARISETPVDIDLTTRQYIAEDSELHTRRRQNMKSHIPLAVTSSSSFTSMNKFIGAVSPIQKSGTHN
jgi:hypothetical protein